MQTNIGLSAHNRFSIAPSPGKILADEHLKSDSTEKAHWNVMGPDFSNLQKFFDQQYNQPEEIIDQVAERRYKFEHYAPETLKQFLKLTHRSRDQRNRNDVTGYIRALLTDHGGIPIYSGGKIVNWGPQKTLGPMSTLPHFLTSWKPVLKTTNIFNN